MDGFDYIIVGAGSAGCVLANRLTVDPAIRVLLLEAGGPYRSLLLEMPLAFMQLQRDPKISWGYMTEPEPHAGGRRLPLPRGKILGGTSSINGMVYSRGHPRDYDQWAQQGVTGWSYADVLPYFKRSEASWRGEGPYHGGSGPLTVSKMKTDEVIFPATMATAKALGYPVLDDHHGETADGFAPAELTIHKGHRGGTAARFLLPVRGRPNLVVETRALAARVIIEGGRAIGVEYQQHGQARKALAEREVILSGGSYNSPQLLMLSGVGPADELKAAGVAPLIDLPGVGRNLQEHALTGIGFSTSQPVAYEPNLRFDRLALGVAQWLLTGKGLATQLPVTCLAFIKTREGLERPDIKANFYPTNIDSHVWFPLVRKGKGHMMSVFSVLLHPESRGSVKLRSADPSESPRVQLNLLAEEADRAALRRSIQMLREFFATQPLASLVGRELWPGPQVNTEAEIDEYIRSNVVIAHHAAGTCAMGVGPDAVVDGELKVRGLDGLRVVDASIMPQVVGGNTNAPVIMIAEKAADMILGRPPLAASPGYATTFD